MPAAVKPTPVQHTARVKQRHPQLQRCTHWLRFKPAHPLFINTDWHTGSIQKIHSSKWHFKLRCALGPNSHGSFSPTSRLWIIPKQPASRLWDPTFFVRSLFCGTERSLWVMWHFVVIKMSCFLLTPCWKTRNLVYRHLWSCQRLYVKSRMSLRVNLHLADYFFNTLPCSWTEKLVVWLSTILIVSDIKLNKIVDFSNVIQWSHYIRPLV